MRQSLKETIKAEIERQYNEAAEALEIQRTAVAEVDLCDYDRLVRVVQSWLRKRSRARAFHGKQGRHARRIAASRS